MGTAICGIPQREYIYGQRLIRLGRSEQVEDCSFIPPLQKEILLRPDQAGIKIFSFALSAYYVGAEVQLRDLPAPRCLEALVTHADALLCL